MDERATESAAVPHQGGHGGGRWCPWCGEPRGADNAPSCLCAQQTADALHDTRAAEAAAVEGFGPPTRIRPYVELEDDPAGLAQHAAHSAQPEWSEQPAQPEWSGQPAQPEWSGQPAQPEWSGQPTQPEWSGQPEQTAAAQGAAPAAAGSTAEPVYGSVPGTVDGSLPEAVNAPVPGAMDGSVSGAVPGAVDGPARKSAAVPPADADVTTTLRRVKAARGLPTPLAPSPGAPDADDLSLFEGAQREPRAGTSAFDVTYDTRYDTPAPRAGRRRRAVLLGAGAVVAVAAAAGLTGGLFSSDTPAQEAAASADVQVAAPDASADGAGADSADATADSAQPSTSASPSASSSPSESASASPSESESKSVPSASPSTSRPAEPTATATRTATTAPPASGGGGQTAAPVLRLGDSGPEVAELQERLQQLRLYNGRIDGRFTNRVDYALRTYQWARGVRSDAPGVYGAETREKLESETS
ncbi:peptidoglycan-binding protein [Streptomyces sp. NPDC059378]|uniref:peptidoglycan-binding protein n=1 Tax=Streptomyces sp. NPDC059378 TaxID=3346815 RepID=UPI0036840EC0